MNHIILGCDAFVQILVDGTDLKTLQLRWWRSQVSLVSQEPTLFDDSVFANIAFSKPGGYTIHSVQHECCCATACTTTVSLGIIDFFEHSFAYAHI